ncbi:MAG: hypothetical protein ABSA33_05435, partial [Candidatus Micrarchaeaceae archaeon]
FRVGFCPKKLLEQLQNLQNHKISQLNMQVQCQREEFQERVGITTLKFNLRVGAGTSNNACSLKNAQLNSHCQTIIIRSLVHDR